MIAEEYGGNVSVVAEDNVFTLNIILPLNRTEEKTYKTHSKKVFYVSRRKLALIFIPLISIVLYVSIGLLIVSNYYAASSPPTPFV